MKKIKAVIVKWWRGLRYAEASFLLLIPEVLIFLFLLIKSVVTGGGLTISDAGLGVLDLFLSVLGGAIPIYGHFVVKNDGKLRWELAFLPHAVLFFLLSCFYYAGLR